MKICPIAIFLAKFDWKCCPILSSPRLLKFSQNVAKYGHTGRVQLSPEIRKDWFDYFVPKEVSLNISDRFLANLAHYRAGSLGLVVMGDDSCLKGCGFKSRRRIPTGWTFWHFFTVISCKNCIVYFKRPKINKKSPGLAQFLKIGKILFFRLVTTTSHKRRSQFSCIVQRKVAQYIVICIAA